MNIFILDTDPVKCATYHNNKHVVKMITESAQILSTVLRIQYPGIDVGYKATHKNHPCCIWARESEQNFTWLSRLVIALNAEYRYRYDKDVNHKAFDIAFNLPMPDNLPNIGLTPFKLAMPNEYKDDDPVKAYRNYYMGEKRHIAHWGKRQVPTWWE